jgi:toxin ParE1/3/4
VTGYLLSPAAQADLEDIWDYTCDRWGIDQADGYLRLIHGAVQRAATNPKIGRPCDDVRPGYLKLAVGSHTLYYRVDAAHDVITVVRVLHQRMDVEQQL